VVEHHQEVLRQHRTTLYQIFHITQIAQAGASVVDYKEHPVSDCQFLQGN
jgi:hypothetical protein